MKISFVIPAFNEEAIVGECITSILCEIARAHADAEILVVNNASTDRTKEVALRVGARVLDEPRKGLVWARSAGQRAATGEIVANIDADVAVPVGWLDVVIREFKNDPKLVALSGPFIYKELSAFKRAMVKFFYACGLGISFLCKALTGSGAILQGGNFCVRREALERAGGYDTSISFYGEDTAIAIKMSTVGKVKWTFRLPVYSSARRLKGEGIIATSWRYTVNFFWVTFFGRPYSHTHKDIRPK